MSLLLALVPCHGFTLMARSPCLSCRHNLDPVMVASMPQSTGSVEAPDILPKTSTEPAREAIKYMRDPDDSYFERQQGLPPVDEELVDRLVAERSVLRANREYEKADVIKAQVVAMGVTIVDMRGRESWYVTKRHSRYIGPDDEPEEPTKPQEPRRDFGPRGHDYARTGGGAKGKAGQTSLGAIDALLSARLMAKLGGNYQRADAKRAELEALGVSVCDRRKQWRADGERFDSESQNMYTRVPGDGDAEMPELDVAPIDALLALRTAAKRGRDFDAADAAAEALREAHSVIVDDQRKTWRVVKLYGGFYRVGSKVGIAEAKIGSILTRRSDRLQAHGEGDEEAAQLTAELTAMGVQLDERRGTWQRPKRSPEEMARVREEMAAKRAAYARPTSPKK